MEKGEVFGIVGMALGIGAVTNIVMYIIYLNIPYYASIMPMLRAIVLPIAIATSSIGLILSVVGLSKKSSIFGILGLIFSIVAIISFVAVIVVGL